MDENATPSDPTVFKAHCAVQRLPSVMTPSIIHLKVGNSPGSQRADIKVLRAKTAQDQQTGCLDEIRDHETQEENIVAGVWAALPSGCRPSKPSHRCKE
jgi:hypothetical protein